MGKSKTSGRRKRRGGAGGGQKKGVLLGMRSGFKSVANSVVGADDKPGKKNTLLGTLVTVLLVIAAAAVLYRRFG
jgi:hypothetical protein